MNVVREIQNINKAELNRGGQGGSWHDQYKDSAYIFIGGLDSQLTEGDVITIFSQYGEPVDVNLPRDKQTGKSRGFGFLMYEDQKSTILAIDNLNGAKVLNRTLRVDHVTKYKHLEKGDDGKFKEADSERMNARPELFMNKDRNGSDESGADDDDLYDGIDLDDPMAAYLVQQRREERQMAIANGTYMKRKKTGNSKAERRDRKEERRRRRADREARQSRSSRVRAHNDNDDEDRWRTGRSQSRSDSPPRRRREGSEGQAARRRYETVRDDHNSSSQRPRSRSRTPVYDRTPYDSNLRGRSKRPATRDQSDSPPHRRPRSRSG